MNDRKRMMCFMGKENLEGNKCTKEKRNGGCG
jgi:hypothetical protein